MASLRDFRARLSEAKTAAGLNEKLHETTSRAAQEFEAGMDDDLNTSVALAVIHNLTRDVNTALARKQLLAENQSELLELLQTFRHRAEYLWRESSGDARQRSSKLD